MRPRMKHQTAHRANKVTETDRIVTLSNHWQETLFSPATTTALAFAATALFEILRSRLEHSLPRPAFDAVSIAFGTLLATVLTFRGRRPILSRARAIQLERDLLRVVTDGLPAGIFAKDLNGRYVMANRKFAEYKGMRSGADIVGKTAFDFMPEDEAVTVAAEDFDIKNAKSSALEFERTTIGPRGEMKWDR